MILDSSRDTLLHLLFYPQNHLLLIPRWLMTSSLSYLGESIRMRAKSV